MNIFSLIPGNPALSATIVITFILVLLYVARKRMHEAIKSFCKVIYASLRLFSRSVLLAQARLRRRNKEVILQQGSIAAEKDLEREFQRVDAIVKRDLSGYPAINRNLSDLITKIDEDYGKSTETPPVPPGWVEAVEAVSKITPTGDTMVAKILDQIHSTIKKHETEATKEYRDSTKKRHDLLKKMMPFWRKLSDVLSRVDKEVTGLQERSVSIDRRMEEYEDIRRGTDKSVRLLSSSSSTQFFISGLILMIAIAGAMINFNLIALPMSEMVGGGSYIGAFKTSDIAALVIILIEITMGLFLMECLHITHLFPVIGVMDDKLRKRMLIVSLTLLVVMAMIESSLAFMRDIIAADMQALRQSLSETTVTQDSKFMWIPTVGQMVMGFILPFALTFVAIPLENFIHSARTVIGIALETLLRALAFVLRLVASLFNNLSKTLVNIYDLLIFLPLALEKVFSNVSTGKDKRKGESHV